MTATNPALPDTHELPKLPESFPDVLHYGWILYTGSQMHAYLLADRSARAPTLASGDMVIVPWEPTLEMLRAGCENREGPTPFEAYRPSEVGAIYRDMITAAPATSLLASNQKAEMPSLYAVIQWLENGCDPKEAAKELRLYEEDRLRHSAAAWREEETRQVAATSLLASEPVVSEWISTEDRLPEKREKAYQVISIAKKLHGPGNYEGQGIKAVAQDWNVRNYASNYTHWMYLPATPGESA